MSKAAALLERLAEETWDRLVAAHGLSLSIGEETLTDINLLEMRRAKLSELQVVKVSKLYESRFGLDWDWWVGSDQCGWFRYAVQAKKLDLRTGSYRSLRHVLNDGKMPKTQFERLLQFAKRANAIPIYVLYNGGNVPVPKVDGCEVKDSKQFGCSVAMIEAIEPSHQKNARKSFYSVHHRKGVFPWRCLVAEHCNWAETFKASSDRPHPLVPSPTVAASLPIRPDMIEGGDMVPAEHVPPQLHKSVPKGIRQLISGETTELSSELYPDDVAVPKRIAVMNVSDTSSVTELAQHD